MKRSSRYLRRTAVSATLALTCSLVTSLAQAANPVPNMVDLDQMRDGLETNANGVPGAMFCVPTATMNALYFLENHGFNGLVQGSTFDYYGSQATYNVQLMGWYMDTDGVNGTGGGMVDGLMDYLDDYAQDLIYVYDYWYDDGDKIDANLLKSWLNYQGTVLLNWGTFKQQDSSSSKLSRVGGHETTLVGLTSVSGYTLSHTDPASDESPRNTAKQSSPFKVNTAPMVWKYANYEGNKISLLHSNNPGSLRAVDGITVIRPLFIWHSYDNLLNMVSASSPKNDQLEAPLQIDVKVAYGKGVLDMALHPVAPTGMYLMNGSNGVFSADLSTGAVTQLATLNSPRRLTYGGAARTLFVLDGSSIVGLDATGKIISTIGSRVTLDTLAYDPIHDQLVGVSRSSGQVVFYDTSLRYLGAASLGSIDGTGRLNLSIDRRSGKMFLHADGSAVVSTIGYDTTGTKLVYGRVALQTTGRPSGLFADDHGYLFTSEEGTIHEYRMTGEASRNTQAAGVSSGAIFALPRMFSNYDERTMGMRNTDASEWDAEMP